jgi:hypothetical protein
MVWTRTRNRDRPRSNTKPPQPLTRPGGTANLKEQADVNNPNGRTGHLYAIEFSTGIVKVGQSKNITRRIASHVAAAAIHDVTADRIWISEPVGRLDDREQELIAFCRKRWPSANGGEYFRHANIARIIEWATASGAPTREVRGHPLPVSDNEGSSFTRAFKALPVEAANVRAWTCKRIPHAPDAPQVANELFTAVLHSGADVVEMTLSTAGTRLKITATGPAPLPLRDSHGPGWPIVAALSTSTGITTDERGVWAQMEATP